MKSKIQLENITFAYAPDEPPVLRRFCLTVQPGECVLVKGENGAGKTTLFRILNGLSFPQEGTYLFEDIPVTEKYLKDSRNAKAFHKRMGYLFQNPDVMLFNASVYDEIAFGPRQMGLTDAETAQRVQDCLTLFGLEHLQEKAPYHLSGGQKKRVALAAVMALNPEVLVLDEPFANLDAAGQAWLREFLLQLKQAGKTILLAAHEEKAAEALADRAVAMSKT